MRTRAALGALLALGACQPAPRAAKPAPPVTATATAPTPAGPRYRIDSAHSELRVLAYRAGALARFGHNHVLVSRELTGSVRLASADSLAGASFEVEFPVAGLSIDDSSARRAEGAEFASEPSAADIEGTRHNLLGPGVLDAEHFPRLAVHGTTAGGAGGLTAALSVEVRGQASSVSVPVTASRAEGLLTIRGGFGIKQSALGLTPFSAALGALSVRDELEVRFEIRARPET